MSWQGTQTRAESLLWDSQTATVGVAGWILVERIYAYLPIAQDTSPRRRRPHEIRQKGMRL